MLPVQLANFFVSDLTWASHDSFSSITTPKNLISETRFISVAPIIIGGILSFSLSFSSVFFKVIIKGLLLKWNFQTLEVKMVLHC